MNTTRSIFVLAVLVAACGGAVETSTGDSDHREPVHSVQTPEPQCSCTYDYDKQTGGLIGWYDCNGLLVDYDGGTVPSCGSPN